MLPGRPPVRIPFCLFPLRLSASIPASTETTARELLRLSRRLLGLCIVYFACLSPSAAARSAKLDPCAAGLVPDISIQNVDQKIKWAFLELIDETNYSSARNKIEMSGDLELAKLITLGETKANYEQFQENLRKYRQEHQFNYDSATAVSIVRYSIPESARRDYFKCVRGGGLRVFATEEHGDLVTFEVHYSGNPGSSVNYTATILGGTREPSLPRWHWNSWWGKRISSGGANSITVRRAGREVILVSVDSGSLTDTAVSVVPPPAPAPQPRVDSVIKVVEATYAGNCGGRNANNMRTELSNTCDGRTICYFTVQFPGDPCFGVHKTFKHAFSCSGSDDIIRTSTIGGNGLEANGMSVTLSCK